MADKSKDDRIKTDQDAKEVERNEGRGVPNYDEKHPNPADIHSDDPLVAGLANGERQAEGKGDEGGFVQ